MSLTLAEIAEFAKQSIYHGVRHSGHWKSYEVYKPIFNDNIIRCIGQPEFIFVKDDEMRFSEPEEAFEYIRESRKNNDGSTYKRSKKPSVWFGDEPIEIIMTPEEELKSLKADEEALKEFEELFRLEEGSDAKLPDWLYTKP